MRTIKLLFSGILLLFVSCSHEKEDTNPVSKEVLVYKNILQPVPDKEAYSPDKIKQTVITELNNNNDFRWSNFDVHFIWSAAQVTKLVAIGYMPDDFQNFDEKIHTIDISSEAWKSVHDSLIEAVLTDLNQQGTKKLEKDDIIYEDDNMLPIIIFRLTDKYAITHLQNLKNVRYVEPYGYWPDEQSRSTSGCSASTTALNASDYSTILPNCILPWNYTNLNIPSAWNIATGENIQLGVIDGGISSSQTLLNGQFNSGYSNNGRTITTDYTYGTSAFTSCTHGTSMCGLIAGPRNNQNGVTGVAYKSSLHFIHGCEDVVLDQSGELSGVKNALVKMGNLPNLRIISMSIGTPFYSGVLNDGVNYAYGKGKMIFAAAGTSFSWTSWWGVVYPAALAKCIAVTGVKENGNTCSSCHDGSQVKFTIPMERNTNSSRNSLSLPYTGVTSTYIGGSSCATATAAGIAALVWSVKLTLTRSQILDCLKNTSQFPAGVNNHGYGNMNALAAVTLAQTL